MAKPQELRAQTKDQLSDRLVELKREQFNLRFQRASGQLENTSRFRAVRREIARIRTLLGETARAASAAPKSASQGV